jgi:hypothetical protein
MLKQKGNKFYIGKQEVILLAIYLPDLFLEKPQDNYFYFNPKNNKFEMVCDNTFAYFASQVFYDSNFIILAKFKKSDRVELIQDKTFLFKYFSDTMDNDEDRQIFLEYGKEEIDKIHASYENMKRLLAGVGAGLFDTEKYIAQWLQKEYGENLIFSITQNDYGYLLKIHEYNKISQYLYKSNFNKDWGKKRVKTELNNLKYDSAFQGAIRLSLDSIENQRIEQILEKARTILAKQFKDENINLIITRECDKHIIIATIKLENQTTITLEFSKDLKLIKILKVIDSPQKEEVIDGISYVRPGSFKRIFANIDHKINLEETDKWLPILDNL